MALIVGAGGAGTAGTARAIPLFTLYANINNFWAALVWCPDRGV